MKTTPCIIALLAASLLPACMPTAAKPNTTSGGKSSPPLNLVITQPKTPDAATRVVSTLRTALSAAAQATSGAAVPNPEIRILRDSGVVSVPAQAATGVGVTLFGENTPAARQQRLENHLNALEAELKSACSAGVSRPLVIKSVKDRQGELFSDAPFTVWAAAGGANPWTEKEPSPAGYVQDESAFVSLLSQTALAGGNFLVLTAPATASAAEKKAQANTKPAKGGKKPKDSSAAERANPDKETAHAPPAAVPGAIPTRGGDVIVGITVEAAKKTDTVQNPQTEQLALASRATPPPDGVEPEGEPLHPARTLRATRLPDGTEPVGNPILFATGSAKLTTEGNAAIKEVANALKASGGGQPARIFLVGSADRRGSEASGKALSQARAEAVEGALMKLGVTVERIIAVGESFSPDDADKTQLRADRFVQVYAARNETTASNETLLPTAPQRPR